MNTISAGDFTVELDITKEMYENYMENFYNPIGKKMKEEKSGEVFSPALYLKHHLSKEVGDMLTKSYLNRKKREEEKQEGKQGLKK